MPHIPERARPRERRGGIAPVLGRLREGLLHGGFVAEASELELIGPRGAAELAARIEQRIDVPQSLRVLAHEVCTCAQSLNPGDRRCCGASGHAAGVRAARCDSSTRVQGWWTIPPQADTKTTAYH